MSNFMRRIVPADTQQTMDELDIQIDRSGAIRPFAFTREEPRLTLFESLGAPIDDLSEWASWYAADRRRRGVPPNGRNPWTALHRGSLDGMVVDDDRFDSQAEEQLRRLSSVEVLAL